MDEDNQDYIYNYDQDQIEKEVNEYCRVEIDLFRPKRHQCVMVGFVLAYHFFFALFYKFDDLPFCTLL